MAQPAVQTAAAQEKPGAHPELIRLLHAAISRHKRYPLSARRMRREGTAQLDFRLHADGRIVICYFSAGSWEDRRSDAITPDHRQPPACALRVEP